MVPFIEIGNTGGGVHCICLVDENTSKVLANVKFKMVNKMYLNIQPLEFRGKDGTRG